MVTDVRNYLKMYNTENQIPLGQILTEGDLTLLAVTISHLCTSKAQLGFNDISHTIFNELKENALTSVTYPIESIPFELVETIEEGIANIALLGYMCFQYFSVMHELPIEKILFVVNDYMNKHKIEQTETHTINCNNPISNLIRINDTQYVKFNGKTILPPTESIKKDFVQQINSLLIK